MNQFLIIVRGSDHSTATPEKMQARMNAFGNWVQNVLKGAYVGCAPLEDFNARLLTSKKDIATDGPFMESKEMISGYIVFTATDIEAATELTKECPLLNEFKLELRQMKPMN